jgi:hypothetical protein
MRTSPAPPRTARTVDLRLSKSGLSRQGSPVSVALDSISGIELLAKCNLFPATAVRCDLAFPGQSTAVRPGHGRTIGISVRSPTARRRRGRKISRPPTHNGVRRDGADLTGREDAKSRNRQGGTQLKLAVHRLDWRKQQSTESTHMLPLSRCRRNSWIS